MHSSSRINLISHVRIQIVAVIGHTKWNSHLTVREREKTHPENMFPISRSLSTSRRRTDELGYRLERPIHFECKLNEPMHIGMRLLHPAAADHSVSINRQQVQRIFSFSLRSRAVTSFCSWLLLNEWIQRVEHALRKTLVLVVRPYSGGGSSHVEWTAHIRLHYPLFVLQMTISPVCFSMLKEFFP